MEKVATRPLVGNRFELSPRNRTLSPERGWLEIPLPLDTLREFVAGVQDHYIQEEWSFQAALRQSSVDLALVFTHPRRTNIQNHVSDPDFLKPSAIEEAQAYFAARNRTFDSGINYWILPPRPVNELLRGTNLITLSGARALYHEVNGRGFTFLNPPTLYQDGVALITVSLKRTDDDIREVEARRREKLEQARTTFRGLNQRLTRVRSYHVDNPRELF